MTSSGTVLTAANFAAIGVGAALGAWLRWLLALALNRLWPMLPMGTLVANLVGGLLIGMAVWLFEHHTDISPEWRLFAVTGFLGGLTTFSTFSAESMALLHRSEYGWALFHTGGHLFGSILFCIAGYAVARALTLN